MLVLLTSWLSASIATGGSFAANLPFVIIETDGISAAVSKAAVLSITHCCPASQMMGTCCSLYSSADTTEIVSIRQHLDSQGKSSKQGYAFRLKAPASILGLPSASNFVLNGPHADQTLGITRLVHIVCNCMSTRVLTRCTLQCETCSRSISVERLECTWFLSGTTNLTIHQQVCKPNADDRALYSQERAEGRIPYELQRSLRVGRGNHSSRISHPYTDYQQ